jgi:secretion/DNA translocation related TadE-like protein
VTAARGGASLVALALAAFLLLAGLLAVDVGALAAARAGAQNAADMAALAALTPGGGSPSARAAAIAVANGAELAACDCSAVQALVTVRRRVLLAPIGLPVWVTARARAVLAARPSAPAARATAPRSGRSVRPTWQLVSRWGWWRPTPGRDGALVGRAGAGVLQRQRDPQRAPLRRRQGGGHLVEPVGQQVRQAGERQAHLGLRGRARQHPPGALPRAGDAVPP